MSTPVSQPGVLCWDEDASERAWAAKMYGHHADLLFVEIRKSLQGSFGGLIKVRIVAHASGRVEVSMNGTAIFTGDEFRDLRHAVGEARTAMACWAAARASQR